MVSGQVVATKFLVHGFYIRWLVVNPEQAWMIATKKRFDITSSFDLTYALKLILLNFTLNMAVIEALGRTGL